MARLVGSIGAVAGGAALLAALAGCGFHLQGARHLPAAFAGTYVAAEDRYTDFHRALGDALRIAGTRVVGQRDAAGAVVEVLSEDTGQRVLSVSARNIPTEYEVFYTIRYRVLVGEQQVLAPQVLTLTRVYSFDENALLAKEQEQDNVRAALARDLAALIMRRLAALPP